MTSRNSTRRFISAAVQINSMQFINRAGDIAEGSTPIIDGLYWGGATEPRLLIESKQVEPDFGSLSVTRLGRDET
jgi:hypothetical protein